MATVETLYVAPKPEPRALRRIRLLSLPFEIAFAGLALIEAALLLLILFFFFFGDPQALRVHPEGALISSDPTSWPADSVAVRGLPLVSRVYAGVFIFALAPMHIMAFVCLARLFA